ncbi:MAG: DUF2232 domain-containing protein [Erysipelotrichaceae bacterium]|nr:DUF2232 domain-containing protein [Erysipelotrichaceae bacterium]
MNNKVRKLTDGAMMLAIVGVFMAVDRFLGGFFGEMVLFAIPLPLVFFTAKYDFKAGLVVYAALGALSVILATPQMVIYVLMESLLGVIYGSGIYRHQSSSRLLGMSIVCATIINLLTTIVFASFFGYNLMEEMDAITEIANTIGTLNAETLPSLIRVAIVLSSLLLGLMEGYLTHMFSQLLLKRLRFDVAGPEPVSAYRPHKLTGYIAFVAVALMTVSSAGYIENELVSNVMMMVGGIGVMYLVIFGYVGLMVVLKHYMPKAKLLISFLLIGLILFASILVMLFGFLYITTDIRERILKEEAYGKVE